MSRVGLVFVGCVSWTLLRFDQERALQILPVRLLAPKCSGSVLSICVWPKVAKF